MKENVNQILIAPCGIVAVFVKVSDHVGAPVCGTHSIQIHQHYTRIHTCHNKIVSHLILYIDFTLRKYMTYNMKHLSWTNLGQM